jgi:hypothetical protein
VLEDEILAYLPDGIKPFHEQLRQFPIGYEKWVYASSLPKDVYQGDVFKPSRFVFIDDSGEPVGGDFVGMVISNTCDVQPRRNDYVLVAPVFDLEDYRKHSNLSGEALENHIKDLTANKLTQLMFLPDGQGFHQSFVDFGQVCAISNTYFHSELAGKRFLSFSQCGHYVMLIKLAHHFARFEAEDAKRQ